MPTNSHAPLVPLTVDDDEWADFTSDLFWTLVSEHDTVDHASDELCSRTRAMLQIINAQVNRLPRRTGAGHYA